MIHRNTPQLFSTLTSYPEIIVGRMRGLDLLRVIAMLFIVGNHWLGHGISLKGFDPTVPHAYFLWFIRGINYMGVNLFVLISSYFLCKSPIRIKHVLSLVCQVLFYSISLYWLTFSLGLHSVSLRSLFESLFPITTSKYWFVTCYIALYLLSPFLNVLIGGLSKRGHQSLLVFLLLLFSIIPNIFFFSPWLNWGGSCGIVWFVVLYFIGAYMRLYVDADCVKKNRNKISVVTILFLCLPFVSKLIIARVTLFITGHVVGSSVFYQNNSILIVPMSISFFLLFMTIEIRKQWLQSVIDFSVKGVLSVYLITENGYIRPYLWGMVSRLIDYNAGVFPVVFVIIVLLVFLSCVMVDCIRRVLFHLCNVTGVPNRVLKWISPVSDYVYSGLEK